MLGTNNSVFHRDISRHQEEHFVEKAATCTEFQACIEMQFRRITRSNEEATSRIKLWSAASADFEGISRHSFAISIFQDRIMFLNKWPLLSKGIRFYDHA